MAKFAQITDTNGLTFHVNVDQIAYMVRGPADEYTRIVFAGDKDNAISVQMPPAAIMRQS
jgi:hypothetical protein